MALFEGYVPTYSPAMRDSGQMGSMVPYSDGRSSMPNGGAFGAPPQMPGLYQGPPQYQSFMDGGISRALPGGSWGVGPNDPTPYGAQPRYLDSFAGGIPNGPMVSSYNALSGNKNVSSPSALAYNNNPLASDPWSAVGGKNTHELEGSNWLNASSSTSALDKGTGSFGQPVTGINVGGMAHESYLNGSGFYQWDNPMQSLQNQILGHGGANKDAKTYQNLDNQVGMSPTTANAAITNMSNDQLQSINPYAMQNAFSQAAQQGANAYANTSFNYAPGTGIKNQSDYNSWLNKDYSAYVGKMNAGHLF